MNNGNLIRLNLTGAVCKCSAPAKKNAQAYNRKNDKQVKCQHYRIFALYHVYF